VHPTGGLSSAEGAERHVGITAQFGADAVVGCASPTAARTTDKAAHRHAADALARGKDRRDIVTAARARARGPRGMI